MEIFESSPSWIMALGKTLVHSLWAGLLFLSVLKLVFIVVAPRLVLLRYRIASLLLFLFAGSMVTMFLYFYAPAAGTGTAASGTRLLLPLYNQIVTGTDWLKLCCYYSTYIYFGGIFLYTLHTLSSFYHIRSIRKGGEPVHGIWLDRFMAMREKTGIHPHVLLLESDRIDTPFLSGFIRPAVVIPTGMLTQLPFSQVEAILVHELFHLKRLDHLANLFQRIVEILFFYNPAIWILSRIVRKERELCCDDMVLKVCPQPLDYARALYKLAMEQRKYPAMVPAATGNNRGQLVNRIQRILNPAIMKTNIREKLSAIMLLTGALLIVMIISGFSSALSITRHNNQPEEISIKPEPPQVEQVVQPVASPEPVGSPPPAPAVQPDTIPIPDRPDDVVEEEDWEEIKKELEAAKKEMESIDWDEIKEELEAARIEAMESIDWDEIKKEMEAARINAMEAIDWDEIKKEIESVKINMDSIMQDLDIDLDVDLDLDLDPHMDFDFDVDFDKESFMKENQYSLEF